MLNKITDRIYYLPQEEYTDRPVLGYIKGDNISLMVDGGNSIRHAQNFLEELNKEELPYPSYVGITHWHWDHCYGISGINALSIASFKTNKKLEEMTKWKWTKEDMEKRLETGEDIKFCHDHILKEYNNTDEIIVKTADIVFEQKLSINLGNISCHLINIDNCHSEDSIIIWVPEEKIIFLGDIHCEDCHNGELKYYRDKLSKLIQFLYETEFNYAVTGHDGPITRKEIMENLEKEYRKL
ncbi:MBL fold metallo-hydrolase [Romboutsia sp.]|uniref:MBL fold metallo-hydrolase n=1 Tax=Romboutsia sp. TaxID=1965302 RepID=UPI003F30F3C3